MIHWNVKEALDLLRVQIHRKHPVCPGRHKKIGHKFGADGNTRLIFAILPGVPIVRQHGGDSVGAGAAEGIKHDE